MAIYYKIRRSDGAYSAGGYWPRFTCKGKVWKSLHALHSHLSGVGHKVSEYDNCELIEIEITEKELSCQPIRDYVGSRNAQQAASAADHRRRQEEARKVRDEAEELATYERLKKKYGRPTIK
jgi:hypothetical protein